MSPRRYDKIVNKKKYFFCSRGRHSITNQIVPRKKLYIYLRGPFIYLTGIKIYPEIVCSPDIIPGVVSLARGIFINQISFRRFFTIVCARLSFIV